MKPLKPANLVVTALLVSGMLSVRAQSTAFTYQGRLRDNTVPATGVFDLRFALYDVATDGHQVGSFVTADDVPVTNGLFCVVLDFGVNAFPGADRWLEISLRPGAEIGDYIVLTPRRALTATPYASYAPYAGTALTATSVPAVNLTGTVPLARLPGEVVLNNETGVMLSGAFSGSGVGLTDVNADLLDGRDGTFYQDARNLTAGTLSDARLSANVALLNANQVFNGSNVFAAASLFAGATRMTNTDNLIVGTHAGDGASLSNLTAAYLSGTVPIATNFIGYLAGDVTGSQSNTVVATVGGVTAANVASGANLANAATSANTTGAIVERDVNGDFAAGTITGALFNGSGSGLTELNGTAITSGTVADGRLSANVALHNADQTFTSSNIFAGVLSATNHDNLLAGTHLGDGSGLSNLTATFLSGTVADARLSANVAFLNASQVFSGPNAFSGLLQLTNPANLLLGIHAGDAANLSNLPAAKLIGTAPSAVSFTGPLAGDVTGSQSATVVGTIGGLPAEVVAAGAAAATNADSGNTANTIVKRDPTGSFAAERITANFVGDGSGLTNINAANIIGGGQGGQFSIPSGLTVVSASANDPALVTNGYRRLMTVSAPAWVNGATSNAPSSRARHTAVWDGQRLIIWGGKITAGASYVASGAMYHPDSDLWEPVSTISAPAARANHTAVWTGTEMIVWGGDGATTLLNSGARFFPDQQKWQAVSTAGAPAERSGHIAVWTGTRMLIWGGQNGSGMLNDGALYDPVANQWSTLAVADPPEARARATAVWAGDRVIIWGGDGSGGVLNSGSQLLFAGGAPSRWLPLASSDAPTARHGHTAVWSGRNMIVWGGGDVSGAPVGGGAVFDPAANTWTALASVGAPVARFHHAAAWTGQEMLIVGGSTSATELASGAAYDPGSAFWWPLSSASSPQARAEATASWTGTEVLVFGGRAQGQYLSALQRLVPQPVWYFYRKL